MPHRSTKTRHATLAATALWALGCGAPVWQDAPHDTLYQRAPAPKLHGHVEEPEESDLWPYFTGITTVQLARMVSPGYHLQQRPGPPAAEDINTFGKVPDSTWFENRMGRRPLSPADVARGPNTHAAPPKGKLLIKSAKTTGATPGFIVEDETGQGWVIKFDSPKYPEISTAAEVICTKIMWSVGYHVPENHVGELDLSDLVLSPKATTKDSYNRKIPLDQKELQQSLAKIAPDKAAKTGKIRAVFSKFLEGRPVGNFTFTGTRLDDPNDVIPHERRRSLRGLWVFYAWVNNTDAKPTNNLDTFVEVDEQRGLGFVRHHLIDFGSALGGNPKGPKQKTGGYTYAVNWEEGLERIIGLGFVDPYWRDVERPALYHVVGNLEWKVFDPPQWKPSYPNQLFDLADPHDTFWAAAILSRFSPEHIRAAVTEGRYSDPAAAAWVTRALTERRSKLLDHAFAHMAPLDDPTVVAGERVRLVDLEVVAGIVTPSEVEYAWSLEWVRRGRNRNITASKVEWPSAHLGGALRWLEQNEGEALESDPFFTMTWQRRVKTEAGYGPPVRVHLRRLPSGVLIPVGVNRIYR